MAHLLSPQKSMLELPVFFNVDGVVGASPAQNSREDVLLVQFAFTLIGKTSVPTSEPGLTEAAKAVRLTGVADPETIQAIRAMQQSNKAINPGTVVDGRVSPAKQGYDYGGGFWTIVNLNDSIQERYMKLWPRIDGIPGCPPELRQMVLRTVQGT